MKLSKQEQKRQPIAWKEWDNKKECQYYNKDFGMCNLKLIIVNEKDARNVRCRIWKRISYY